MDTDTIIAVELASAIASKLQTIAVPHMEHLNITVLPPLTFSCSQEWANSVSLAPETMFSILDNLAAQTAGPFVVVSAHGGNAFLENWCLSRNRLNTRFLWLLRSSNWKYSGERSGLSKHWLQDIHAGEIETSLMLYLAPAKVDISNIPADTLLSRSCCSLGPVFGLSEYAKNGVIGCPSKATRAKGALLLNSLVASCLADILECVSRWKHESG